MKFDISGFCAGIAATVTVGFLSDTTPPDLLLLWFLLSFGVVIGAGLVWFSGCID